MILPPPPILAAIAAAALLASATAGYKLRDWQCDAALSKALIRAEKQRKEMQDEVDQSARDYETARFEADGLRTTRATDIRTIYREVPAPPAYCAAPDSVVGLLQSGVRSANANASGEPTDTVPASEPGS